MVSNASSTKKCPPNIRTGNVHPPVLVSPISVAHRNKMMEADGAKKSSNWMRDQWVANLKKKRLAAAAAAAAGGLPLPPALPVKALQPNKADNKTASEKRTTKSSSSRASRSKKNAQKDKDTPSKDTTGPMLVPPMLNTSDKDALDLMHPAMFFQDLGSFEIESQSFTRLTPHGHSHSHHPHHQHHAMMTATATLGDDSKGMLDPLDAASPSMSSGNKNWNKPPMKKRSNSFSVEVVEPKRRTPRRLYPTGSPSFDDDLSSSFSSTSSHSFSSVGTPTNFSSAEISRMWGPELDFPGGYVDTFLDLPTPKCADMPTVSSHDKKSSNKSVGDDLEQPKLVRTTSIEQEGLSQFLEQTTLESESPPPRGASTPSSSRQSNNALRRGTPTAGYSRQAQVAVDEYFGKMLPSPAPHRSQVVLAHGRMQVTPRRGEYSFDSTSKSHQQQHLPEFETLLDEYKFTDIDQELDSFYLDTIESFGGDIDLIPH